MQPLRVLTCVQATHMRVAYGAVPVAGPVLALSSALREYKGADPTVCPSVPLPAMPGPGLKAALLKTPCPNAEPLGVPGMKGTAPAVSCTHSTDRLQVLSTMEILESKSWITSRGMRPSRNKWHMRQLAELAGLARSQMLPACCNSKVLSISI